MVSDFPLLCGTFSSPHACAAAVIAELGAPAQNQRHPSRTTCEGTVTAGIKPQRGGALSVRDPARGAPREAERRVRSAVAEPKIDELEVSSLPALLAVATPSALDPRRGDRRGPRPRLPPRMRASRSSRATSTRSARRRRYLPPCRASVASLSHNLAPSCDPETGAVHLASTISDSCKPSWANTVSRGIGSNTHSHTPLFIYKVLVFCRGAEMSFYTDDVGMACPRGIRCRMRIPREKSQYRSIGIQIARFCVQCSRL